MQILDREVITNVKYVITTVATDVGVVVVKDLYEGDKIIDTQYLSKLGYEIDNAILVDEIEEFLNVQELEQNGWSRD